MLLALEMGCGVRMGGFRVNEVTRLGVMSEVLDSLEGGTERQDEAGGGKKRHEPKARRCPFPVHAWRQDPSCVCRLSRRWADGSRIPVSLRAGSSGIR